MQNNFIIFNSTNQHSMFKFFRRIRQQLLGDNKFTKYLIYAIGEIVLVVIGILIALSINNWNQRKILKSEELRSLESLQSEFQENLENFDKIQALQKEKMEAINLVLFSDISEYSLSGLDSLNSKANFSWTYNPSFGIYDALINSGKIQLIANETLKVRISKYKELVGDYLEDELFIMKFTSQFIIENLINDDVMLVETKFDLRDRTKNEELNDRENYLNKFKSHKYRNQLSILLLNGKPLIFVGNELRAEMISLMEMIEFEIEKLR